MALPIRGQNNAYAQALHSYYQANFKQAQLELTAVDSTQNPNKPILQSLIFLAQHQPVQAKAALDQAQRIPGYKDYFDYIEFLISLENQDLSESQDIMEQRWEYENIFLLHKSQVDYAQALYDHGQFAKAAELCSSLLNTQHDPVITPQALKVLLYTDLEARNRKDSFTHYGQLMAEYPATDPDGTLWRHIQSLLKVNADLSDCFKTPKDHLNFIKTLYTNKQYDLLVKQVNWFMKKFGRNDYLGDVYFYQGLAYMQLGRYTEAKRTFELAAIRDVGKSMHSRDLAYSGQAAIYAQDLRALTPIKTLLKNYPKSSYAPWACYQLCIYYSEHGDYTLFAEAKKTLSTQYKDSPYWQQFIWDQGQKELKAMALKRSSPSDFNLFFSNLVRNSVVAAHLFKFYQRESGNVQIGFLNTPISYLTNERLIDALDGKEQYPDSLKNLAVHVDTLYQMGLGVLASQEVLSISTLQPDTTRGLHLRYLYGTLLAKLRGALVDDLTKLPEWEGNPLTLVQDHMPRFLLKLFYPRPYWDHVQTYSKLYNIDPYLVLAVMREESTFDTLALSKTQAKGLMQVSNKTGREVAFRLGIHWKNNDQLFDPATNIRIGTYYLSWLKRQFPGPNFYSLAAYNAGPDSAYRWIHQGPTQDLDAFVDRIPYAETRLYVRRVLNSYLIYKILYTQ